MTNIKQDNIELKKDWVENQIRMKIVYCLYTYKVKELLKQT